MTIKKLIKNILIALMLASAIQPVTATDTSTEATETVVSGEGSEQVTTSIPTESLSATWCEVGQFATGYANRNADIPSPSGSDPYLMTPQKSYTSDQCFTDFASAQARASSLEGTEDRVPIVVVVGADMTRIAYAKYGVVLLNNTQTTATFTIHTAPNSTTKKTYVNATSQRDAVLLDLVNSEWAYVMMAGVSGYLKLTNSIGSYIHDILPLAFLDKTNTVYNGTTFAGYKLTRYGVNPNDSSSMYLDVLRGTTTSNLVTSGNAERPSFMSASSNQVYYSYDGHYFYTRMSEMIDDYRNKTIVRALNQTPYYNYYQYLPARAKTRMTGSTFDAFLMMNRPTAKDNITVCYSSTGVTVSCTGTYAYRYSGPQSILYNAGNAFLQGQDNYGINGALIYVKATLEGAYGMSTISRAKFNPFGVNAVDSSPFSSATIYSSVYNGVESQFKTLMSLGYVNPFDAYGRYNGSHVGDKASGVNTLYASDPNWGFKLASLYRELDKLSGFVDLNHYQLAVSNRPMINLYTNATDFTVKQVLKQQTVVNNYVFDAIDIPLILVEGLNNGRYKVVMDPPSDQSTGFYYANSNDYAYVDASDIRLINTARNGYQDPKNIGNIIEDTATSVVTFDIPKTLKTNANTSLYDSYRSDITSATTPMAADQSFVAIREVNTTDGTWYEVITDYTRAPVRTKWLKASTITWTDQSIVTTQGSGLNVRSEPSTSSTSKGTIQSDRAPLLYLGSNTGTSVNGNTTWYHIILNPLTGESGYVSAAFSVLSASGGPSVVPVPTYSSINTLKNLFINQNPYLLGTGIISGVDAYDSTAMTYVLQFTKGTTIYTHPLKTTTSLVSLTDDTKLNPNGNYNYDYAWYEGTIDFYGVSPKGSTTPQSLPSGTYQLSVLATGGGKTETFRLINAENLTMGSVTTVDSKLSYRFVQDANKELSITVTNATATTPTTPSTGSFDLAKYSTATFPIYPSSRVIYLSLSGSTINIQGYSLEQFVSYSRANTFVRELIFIADDQKTSYRVPLTSVYNPFLNKNKTLNPSGKYNYNYAYYKSKIDLNRIQEYWTKKTVSLPKGNYRVFIRMSDGKRSNVMSLRNLKDEVKLPSAFYLIQGTNDVGFKR